MKLKNHKTKPVIANKSGLADLRVYNVILNINSSDSTEKPKVSPIIFCNKFGFSNAREALLNLHDTLETIATQSISHGSWSPTVGPEHCYNWQEEIVREYIIQLQKSDLYELPGGWDVVDDMRERGWSISCELFTGICVTITDFAENILSNKKIINDIIDVFEGINESDGLIYNECIKLQILVVSNIYGKIKTSSSKSKKITYRF